MRRKLLYCILLLPAFLLAACEVEIDNREIVDEYEIVDKPDSGQSPMTFSATIEGDDATKTTLGALSGGKRPVKWSSDDSLRIGGAIYHISGIAAPDSTSATFSGSGATTTSISGTDYYEAYYPASLYSKTGSTVTLTLPPEQVYTALEGNRVASSHLPMYARSTTTNLNFKNLCAVLNFQLKGNGRDVIDSVVVTSSDKYLSGTFQIAGDETNGWYAQITSTGANRFKRVKLDCSATQPKLDSLDLYVAVPAQNYPAGSLTVKVYSTSTKVGAVEVLTFTNQAVSQLERSQIYAIKKSTPGFTVGPNPEDKVYFASGNLQVNYFNNGSGGLAREWLFSENPWDIFFPSTAAVQTLPTPPAVGDTVKISHFGWATAGHKNLSGEYGYSPEQEYYEPYMRHTFVSGSQPLGTYGVGAATWLSIVGTTDGGAQENTWRGTELCEYFEWGVHFNENGVGIDEKYDGTTWFTLSAIQTDYITKGRTFSKATKVGLARIDIDPRPGESDTTYRYGLVILPDVWQCPDGCSFVSLNENTFYIDSPQPPYRKGNVYEVGGTWDLMEASGAVFLPAGGGGFDSGYYNEPYRYRQIEYWTSSHGPATYGSIGTPHRLFGSFSYTGSVVIGNATTVSSYNRGTCCLVRLVKWVPEYRSLH